MADIRMGKSLQRAKKKRQLANRANFQAILEQEHRQHVSQETAPKLQSVWQTTNLDDVLEAAGEREDGYAALRDVRVVVSGTVHVVSGDKVVPMGQATADTRRDWYGLSEKLPIPERPQWNFRMKADEVQLQEKRSFVEWRRDLARAEEADKIVMTPFEKNLEVWRQLWRVVEKSDVVLQIVDARNPLAFRSAGLERYVAKHHTKTGKPKPVILLLNKADLLTEQQRKHWAAYLQSKGLRFYFFSAVAGTEAAKPAESDDDDAAAHPSGDLARRLADADAERDAESDDDDDEEDDEEEEDAQPAAAGAAAHRGAAARGPTGAAALDEERMQAEALRRAADERRHLEANTRKERRRKDRRTRNAPVKVNPYAMKSLKEEAEERNAAREAERAKEKPLTAEERERDARLAQSIADRFQPWDLLDPVTLLDALAVMRAELGVVANQTVMVGLCGYPNVGKSSTINAIMQCKKVVVSATPGKTKHFQTLPIPNERRLVLCDCPGLVFPSFASTKEAMVCDGILPVDTCRDYLAAVAIVCDRVPRGVLERQYFIVLDKEFDMDLSASRAELFLNYLSRRKGYMTEHDKPNRYRSAHHVLKDYVDGKVVFVHPPPGLALEDPNPPHQHHPQQHKAAAGAKPTAAKGGVKGIAARPAPAGVPKTVGGAAAAGGKGGAAEEEEGWETASDDGEGEEEEWETASDEDEAAGAAHHRDDDAWEDIDDAEDDRHLSDDEADSVVSDEEDEPLTFYGATILGRPRPLTTAEVFNMERNKAIIDAPEDAPRPKKKKVNPMLVPDETVRINRHGDKELLLDEDDEIVICGMDEAKEKKVSKRTARRQAKRGVVAARGAKPAALPGAYEARSAEVEMPAGHADF